MTDTHALTGLPASVRDLTLDLTNLAHQVTYAASVRQIIASRHLERSTVADATVELWETLTGLTGDAAMDAAQAITRHPLPVTAAVVPL